MNRAERLEAAADSLSYLAVSFICEPENWPAFAAWSSRQEGAAWIPGTPDALRAVRAILVQREAACILKAFT